MVDCISQEPRSYLPNVPSRSHISSWLSRRLRYPALPGQLRTRLPPDDVTFSGTTRRWEFNYQHWVRIDRKQPNINLRVEGLATNANRRYASQQRWGHNGAARLLVLHPAWARTSGSRFNVRCSPLAVSRPRTRRGQPAGCRPELPMSVVNTLLLWPYICTSVSWNCQETLAHGRR